MLASVPLAKRPTTVPNFKSLRLFAPFAWPRERISTKMHCTESRFVTGPSNRLFSGVYRCTFQARKLMGAGIAQWLERRTRDWKVAGSNPCWNGGIIFFSRVDFLCWLLFRYPFHPRVTTVARKKSRSFCQKCRWQVTAKTRIHLTYVDFIEPCFGIGHSLSLICQMTSEDIKHQLIIISKIDRPRGLLRGLRFCHSFRSKESFWKDASHVAESGISGSRHVGERSVCVCDSKTIWSVKIGCGCNSKTVWSVKIDG